MLQSGSRLILKEFMSPSVSLSVAARRRRPGLASCASLVVGLAIFASACSKSPASSLTGRTGTGRGGARASVAVESVAPVERIAVQRRVDLSGTLLSPDQAKVSSEVAGVVREVPVQLGTVVKQGDVLVRIDERELKFALDRSESALNQVYAQLGISNGSAVPDDQTVASVKQAAANLDDAKSAYARAETLSTRGLLSKVDKDTAETRLKVSQANYDAALDNVRSLKASLLDRRAAFELARKKVADASIRAPVAGAVADRFVQPGEYINVNTPVVSIVQMSPLKLKTAVQEKFASVIRPGQKVQFAVEAFPDAIFDGEVAYVSPAIDQATRTFSVEALVQNADGRLKPGFFAKGTVSTHLDENVPAVSLDAVSTLAGVSSVYIIEDGKIRQQTVALGSQSGKLVEITQGLKGDEKLAASNLNQLATGTPVTIGKVSADGGGRGRRGGEGNAPAAGAPKESAGAAAPKEEAQTAVTGGRQ